MNYDKYEFVMVSENLHEFNFKSIGPKGIFTMLVQFQRINTRTFNLAFGKEGTNGKIDDSISLRNFDRDKILATVAAAVFRFTEAYPHRVIFFSSNSPARRRLYRMAIGVNLEQLQQDFVIFGVMENKDNAIVELFVKNSDYQEFFIERKSV